jgi:hypothetical protein
MFTLIDAITAGFLGAIDAGQQALAVFALPILAICALISYYREYSATVMSSGAGLGDYLAHALGWLTGSLIRALVSSAMVGIATPLFDLLNQPLPSTGFFSIPQTFLLLCSSVMYLILCWTIPSLASRLAGQASLGLTGSTLTSAAMGMARFSMMAVGMANTASRVISPMLRRS